MGKNAWLKMWGVGVLLWTVSGSTGMAQDTPVEKTDETAAVETAPAASARSNAIEQDRIGLPAKVSGKIVAIDQYPEGIWVEVARSSSVKQWVALNTKALTEGEKLNGVPLEVGCNIEVSGVVAKDRKAGGLLLDAKSSDMPIWKARRASDAEKSVLQSEPVLVSELGDISPGTWISVTGIVTGVSNETNPAGLWIEIKSGEAEAGVWIEGTVAQRLAMEVLEGDSIQVTGTFQKADEPLKAEIDVCTPDHLKMAEAAEGQ